MSSKEPPGADALLTPGEVAQMFGVGQKTVNKWANEGRLTTSVRTLGGHRRFRADEVRSLLSEKNAEQPDQR